VRAAAVRVPRMRPTYVHAVRSATPTTTPGSTSGAYVAPVTTPRRANLRRDSAKAAGTPRSSAPVTPTAATVTLVRSTRRNASSASTSPYQCVVSPGMGGPAVPRR
jgi:hypothetical protein